MSDHPSTLVGEILAGSAVVGTALGYAPEVAALFAIVFYAIRIWRMMRGRENGE